MAADSRQKIDDKVVDGCIALSEAIVMMQQDGVSEEVIEQFQVAIDDIQSARDYL